MGFGMAGVGFALAHDGQHAALSKRPFLNRLAGLTFDVMGVCGYFWRLTHNRIHHMYTNIPGLDEDIDVTPLIRMSPGRPRRAIHRFQHVFAYPIYALLTLSWVLMKDYVYLFRRRMGPFEPVPRPRGIVATVLAGKLVNYAWTIVVPCLVLQPSLGTFLAGYLTVHLTASLVLSVVFQLAHHVEATAYPQPAEGRVPETWAVHQLRTTADFARGNRLLGWYLGGLNFQIEHHLFPNICSIHYPKMSPIVEACAKRHRLPFHAAPSMWSALCSHTRRLRQLGGRVQPDLA
jgi:linoleoyl-CoA desaturase